jgi:cbb3-type cytochrome oxidase subunit 1
MTNDQSAFGGSSIMQNLAIKFIRCAVIYGLAGMALGIVMAASNDHGQAPTHAHVNLLGWVSMAIFGLVYRAFPSLAQGTLPKVHFWLMNVGVIGMIAGLFLMFSGHMEFVPLTAISSVVIIVAMLLFTLIVYRAKID